MNSPHRSSVSVVDADRVALAVQVADDVVPVAKTKSPSAPSRATKKCNAPSSHSGRFSFRAQPSDPRALPWAISSSCRWHLKTDPEGCAFTT